LLPGTELAFEKEVECDGSFRFLPTRKTAHRVARFRQVNLNRPAAHHDALEFPDGKIVMVTDLCEGQYATVLQLPSQSRPAEEQGEREGRESVSITA
jgi:ribosomal 50S subunit-recycling heat shock protein